jgi:hypothetical protein
MPQTNSKNASVDDPIEPEVDVEQRKGGTTQSSSTAVSNPKGDCEVQGGQRHSEAKKGEEKEVGRGTCALRKPSDPALHEVDVDPAVFLRRLRLASAGTRFAFLSTGERPK